MALPPLWLAAVGLVSQALPAAFLFYQVKGRLLLHLPFTALQVLALLV